MRPVPGEGSNDPELAGVPAWIANLITRDPESGCWAGLCYITPAGYAVLPDRRRLHRVVWETLVGPIPAGLVLDHVRAAGCTWNSCCNPAHLEPVTQQVNILRGRSPAAVNARKTECGTCGTPYDQSNTYRAAGGSRRCRACRASWARENRRPRGAAA